jgi:hypothetical protein
MIVEVLTGHEWLAEMFDGAVNSTGTAKIEVMRTPDNVPYIGKNILIDPTYAEDLEQVINGKKLRDWFEVIEIEINTENE